MTFAQTLTELNTTLGDAGNVTFTPEEKTQALTKAWQDSYVVKTVNDSTITYVAGTFDYAIPVALTTVKDVLYPISTSDAPEVVPSDIWSVTNGRIYFVRGVDGYVTTGTIFTIKGNYKYTVADLITDLKMLDYIIALAAVRTLTLLGYKKVNLFLKNDTSMGELIALKRELASDVDKLRLHLVKEYESA